MTELYMVLQGRQYTCNVTNYVTYIARIMHERTVVVWHCKGINICNATNYVTYIGRIMHDRTVVVWHSRGVNIHVMSLTMSLT